MALAGAVEPPLSPAADLDFDLDYLDFLLQGFYRDPASTTEGEKGVDSPSGEGESIASSDPVYPHLEVERGDSGESIASSDPVYPHLEVEGGDSAVEGFYVDDFLADLFDLGSREAETPDPEAAIDGEGKGDHKEEEDEEPASKKLKSDSAMKSRPRTSMYLKENKDLDASAAEQESAVLFEESLPMGSLLRLVSIICSFLLPDLGDQNLNNTKGQGIGNCHEIVMNGGVKNTILEMMLGSRLGNFGRRCRGTRSRIKRFDLLHVVEVL